jgi:hypothetical protein
LWLEILDRYEKGKKVRHYSVFNFSFHRSSQLDPFLMTGQSFRTDGTWHSSWSTKFLRIQIPENEVGVSVEYVYNADIGSGERRTGWGISHFMPDGGDKLVVGNGYYLAGEEESPYRCSYELQRIDAAFQKAIGARINSLQKKRLAALIPLIREQYEQVSKSSDRRSKGGARNRRHPDRVGIGNRE